MADAGIGGMTISGSKSMVLAGTGGTVATVVIAVLLVVSTIWMGQSAKKDTENADMYLSYSILSQGDKRFHTVCAAALLFSKKGRFEDAIDILNWGIETDEIFRSGDKINFFDRLHCYYMAAIAFAKLKLKDKKAAQEALISARDLAVRFDEDPDLDGKNLRFVELDQSCMVVDSSGETALESVGKVIALLEDKELMKLWQKITE